MRTTLHYPESPYGRTYADVITKISRMDSLPNYLSYSAPLARASRAQGAPLQDALMIFAYPYPEQTGVNKLLFFSSRKTGTAFQMI